MAPVARLTGVEIDAALLLALPSVGLVTVALKAASAPQQFAWARLTVTEIGGSEPPAGTVADVLHTRELIEHAQPLPPALGMPAIGVPLVLNVTETAPALAVVPLLTTTTV